MGAARILNRLESSLAHLNNAAHTLGLRVIGDVHGDLQAFRHAIATDRFILQLGDLVDYGQDSVGVLLQMMSLLKTRRGIFVLGNHDRKLARFLNGRRIHVDHALADTLQQINARHVDRSAIAEMLNLSPAWIVINRMVFVHGAFHPSMLNTAPFGGTSRLTPVLSRALFGETTRNRQSDGYPERVLNWVDSIPEGYTVYCGHDNRSHDGRPFVKKGNSGGKAVFLDLGAGKGGHLAWIDIDADSLFNAFTPK